MQMDLRQSAGAAFFLGANTPGGFYSLFDELYDPAAGWRLYIVKGGPGTGKSTLMKRVAAEADRRGLYCERIFCSSDPRSLDAVIVPSLKVSIADGTAPHVLEPRYPGVSETIVDLGAFRDDARLRAHADEILRLTDENKQKHAECTRFLTAAGYAQKDLVKIAAGALELEKTENFIAHLSDRFFGSGAGAEPDLRRRFLSALTPEGVFTFYSTAAALCETRLVLHDDVGLAAAIIVESLCARAVAAGYDVIKCPCPISPETKTDHLFVPALSLGVFTSNRRHPFSFEDAKNVQCTRFFGKTGLREHRNRLRFTAKARNEMLDEALVRLKEAKALHDALEEYYIDAMSFSAVSARAEELVGEIFD